MKLLSILSILLLGLGFNTHAAQKSIDAIVAIVEADVITKQEIEARKNVIRADFVRNSRKLPDSETLHRQVLEVMISDSILIQEAKRRGLKTTEGRLNQAMQKIALDNNSNLSEFRQLLIANDLNYEKYRESIRRDLTVNALRRQYTQRRVTVSDQEVDDFINRSDDSSTQYEYKLAHILIALPDAATPEQISAAQHKSTEILTRLDAGEAFDSLANEFSSGSNALSGGDLGWRKKAEIPGVFTEAVLPMKPGDHAGPLRSASGYHIVYLSDRKDAAQVLSNQVRSRHILLRPNELITEAKVKARLLEFRQRILAGEDFARLARLYSVDYTSGAEGGDIGWMEPGETVKEYDELSRQIEQGKVSEPFRSKFGWHILEVTGRRTVDETSESKREKIYSQLLQQKQHEVFNIWQRKLRDEAYVVFPDA
ncbi:MAG: molecular chaperone SurA [Gammaproteobacteria bacterium]|nr:molecular chaperone SurA [Gammaproteobacteria bacterium]